MKKPLFLFALAAAISVGGGFAAAHDPPDTSSNQASAGHESHHESLTSAGFASRAAQDGMTEVELARVALNKSQDKDVQDFANRMIKDHGKANSQLMSIAQQKKLQVPAQLDSTHRAMIDELRGKSGSAFDAAYSQHMAMDHDKVVDYFKDAAVSKGVDSELSAFARDTLPTLKEHKRMADALQGRKGGTASANSNRSTGS